METNVWRRQKQIQSFLSLNGERSATLLSTYRALCRFILNMNYEKKYSTYYAVK